MNEVMCRVLDVLFVALEKKRGDINALVAGVDVPLSHLRNKQARIDWDVYRQIMANAGGLWSPQELELLGDQFPKSPYMRPIMVVVRTLFSASDFYKWAFNPRGGGVKQFDCFDPSIRESGPGVLDLRMKLRPGYKSCPEFYLVAKGSLEAMPTVLGLPRAVVQLTTDESGATFRVEVPQGGGWVLRIKKALLYPFTMRALAVELREAHDTLLERYTQLSTATQTIDGQKRELELLQSVTSAAHRTLELPEVLAAIAEQVCRTLNYDWCRINIEVEQDHVKLNRALEIGATSSASNQRVSATLTSRGERLGTIEARRATQIGEEERQFFNQVASACGLALSNAISFQIISSYRTELEARVTKRTAELQEARDHIQRTLDSRNRFFANVNHELRTPLSVLMLATDHLAGDLNLSATARDHLETMRTNVERLRALVDELLLLAAGAEDKRNMRLKAVAVGRLVDELVASVRPLAKKKGIKLETTVEPSLVLEGDSRLVERALTNLVTNAIKYTDEGRVEVSAKSKGNEVVFAIKDTGPGIPREYVGRVFDRFFQVPFGKGKPGSGIGLALVKEIALQHEGSVDVESEVGSGSTFILKLPRKATDAVRARSEEVADLPARPEWVQNTPLDTVGAATVSIAKDVPKTNRTGQRVLVVEDDQDLLHQLATTFAAQGWSVDHVTNAEAALERAKARPPDLLITDVDLGAGMNGLELVKAFREVKEHRNAPALVLTANPTYGAGEAFANGAVEYLEKPIKPSELVARVRALLNYRDLQARLMNSERLAAQGAALAGVSHELRNPLNGLINAIEPLRTLLPDDAVAKNTPAGELLSVIEECGQRVAKLSSELLLLTRTDTPRFEAHPIKEVLERAVRATSQKLRGVELRKEIGFEGDINCSPLQLSQILINLIENAVDSVGPGGWVELKTTRVDNRVNIEVRDSGKGVPSELRARIFEPFFTTKPPGKGTGLGLAIARDIARRHGGDLELVQEGAFGLRLWLPAGQQLPHSPAPESLARVDAQPAAAHSVR